MANLWGQTRKSMYEQPETPEQMMMRLQGFGATQAQPAPAEAAPVAEPTPDAFEPEQRGALNAANAQYQKDMTTGNAEISKSLASKAKDSGLSTTHTREGDKKSGATVNKLLMLPDDEFKGALDDMWSSKTMQDQLQGVNRMESLMAMPSGAHAQLDLSPLAALVNNQTGSKFDTTPDRRDIAGDQRAKMMAYLSKIQDDKRDITKSMLDSISKRKAGFSTEQMLATIKDLTTQKAVDPAMNDRKGGGAKDDKIDADVRRLGEYPKKWAPGADVSFRTIDQALQKQGGLRAVLNSDKAVNIPGTGFAASVLPTSWLDDNASKIYRAATSLARQKLQLMSGQQASDAEAQHYLSDLGLKPGASPREAANGLRRLTQEFGEALDANEAQYRPEVVARYRSHPGSLHSGIFQKYYTKDDQAAAATASAPGSSPLNAKDADMKAIKAEIDALSKKAKP